MILDPQGSFIYKYKGLVLRRNRIITVKGKTITMIDIQLANKATYTHQTLNNFSLAELKGLRWHNIRTQTSHKSTLH